MCEEKTAPSFSHCNSNMFEFFETTRVVCAGDRPDCKRMSSAANEKEAVEHRK